MKVLLTGASGFIGGAVISELVYQGHELVLLSRSPLTLEERYDGVHRCYRWDALTGPPPREVFDGVEAVINLMGEGVANKRWTEAQKRKIRETRVTGTRHLMEGAKLYGTQLRVVVSASAVGYYDHFRDGVIDEESPASQGFLGQLCQDWEKAAKTIGEKVAVRTVMFRIGVVLGADGGALSKLVLPFSLGVGGRIGDGKQWMNWVHRRDLARMMAEAVKDERYSGTYNAVAPGNVQNREFSKELGRLLKRPTLFPVPALAIRMLLGEFSRELLYGQRVVSSKFEAVGFSFHYPDITTALEDALSIKYIHHLGKKVRCSRFRCGQYIHSSVDTVFDFFSDARNLEKITPPMLRFKIHSQSTAEIGNGTIFNYRLKVRGIPMRWCSLITDWEPTAAFVDTQLSGPYRVWHHTHRFTPYLAGTFIEDEVYFALPAIPLLNPLLRAFVEKDIRAVFQFRKQEITTLFK